MAENIWETMNLSLDDDERIVFPEMLSENREMFDKITGVAYFVSDKKHGGLEWVWENSSREIPDTVKILTKVYVVRLRPNPKEPKDEWFTSREEYEEHRDYLRILDIYGLVREIDNPNVVKTINTADLHKEKGKYELLETKYLVCLRIPPIVEENLKIHPNTVHTWMSK